MALWDALRHRDFRYFYAGQSVSVMGDSIFYVALSWQVLLLGGDATTLGLMLGVYMLSQVLLLALGGVVVDRFRRRDLVIVSDLVQGALVAALAATAFLDVLTIPMLLGFAVAFGAATALGMPATTALVPETVPAAALASANSLWQGSREVAILAGPALGGLLVAWQGPAAAFAIDAGTFAVSLTLTTFVRGSPAPARRGATLVADAREGLGYVLRRPWLWITILVFSLMNVAEAGPRNVALPLLVSDDLGLGSAAFGLAVAAPAAGALVAFLVIGSRPPNAERRGLVGYVAISVSGAAFLAAAFARDLPTLLALFALKGAAVAVFSILWETTIGDSVAAGVRGRVVSLDMLGSFILLPVAMWGTGLFTATSGASAAFAIGGAALVALGLVGVLVPAARAWARSA